MRILIISIFSGILDWISGAISNGVGPGVNTFATNFFQCLEQGPRFVYNDLDLEHKQPENITTTTEPATPRIISGYISYLEIHSITTRVLCGTKAHFICF